MAGHPHSLRALALLLIVILAGACARQPVDESAIQGENLGVVAEPLASDEAKAMQEQRSPRERKRQQRRERQRQRRQSPGAAAPASATEAGRAGGQQSAGATSGGGSGGGGAQAQPARPASFVVLGQIEDRAGDAGPQTPGYADTQRLVIESNGATARVSMVVNQDLPAALADGEVQGIGINFYRSDDRESDYQLFADGGYKGWRAFLHTPDGIVPFPGAFRVGGRVLVFEVPWSALGGKTAVRVGAFVDWAQQGAVLAASGNDRAPNDGTLTVRPARG